MFFLYIFFLVVATIIFNKYLIRNKYLVSETGDSHQRFASKMKIPLSGGVLIFLSFLYFFDQYHWSYFFFAFLILFLGVVSDLKLIKSAKKRLIFQFLIVMIFIIINDILIVDTRIDVLDEILNNQFLNYFFVCFCFLIIINGSNFFDGLNTLNSGYFLLISSIIIFLQLNENIASQNLFFKDIIIILSIMFILNFFNKIFLGDSGSYLLGFVFSLMLINLYKINNNLMSPFFIILLLWYPSFETLFSMIRKNILNRSPMKPDSNHLHQLIFFYIKKNFFKKALTANLISANLINLYNLLIFLISLQFIMDTQIQIILILLNLITYTVIYFKLFVYRYKKL
tara:strand:- start:1503 stop:2525 length:1023 start_codon:yes stop_codon:yes gene_type:complete